MNPTASQFNLLKAFFVALDIVKYNLDKVPPVSVVQGTPINKKNCLELLREFPQLKGTTDHELAEYLKKPNILNELFGKKQEQLLEIEKAIKENNSATTGVTAEQPAGQETPPSSGQEAPPAGATGGVPNIPSISAPSISSGPLIHNIPHTPEPPKPDIAIANKSGVVAEAPPSQFHVTDSAGNIQATYSKEPLPAATQPKLVLARSDGSIIEPFAKPTSIAITDSGGKVVREHAIPGRGKFNFPAFRSRLSDYGKNLQNFASRANPFLKTNLSRIGQGLRGMGGSLAHTGLPGVYNAGARMGLGAINQGANAYGRFSRFKGAVRRPSFASLKGGGGKWKFILPIVGIFFLTGFMAFTGADQTGTVSTGITGTGGSGLDYTLPLKDPSVQPLDIRSQVKAAFPGAKLEYWDKVVKNSQDAGWNPALTLSLWIEETGASQTTLIRNGGSEIPVNGNLSKGHLGCAPGEDQTIDESLTCLFKMGINNNFTSDQFGQFMALYSGGPAGNPFANNPDFPGNIKAWYSRLVPSGNGAITPINPGLGNFNIDISALPASYQQWAQEILNTSTSVAPMFKNRINAAGNTKVVLATGDQGSHTEGTIIYIRSGYDTDFFKQIFIHELGHRIKGPAGNESPSCNGQNIESVESEGYLTYYAEHATPAHIRTPACGKQDNPATRNDQATRSDEDFGESVSYYINNIGELPYGSGCETYSAVNPYKRGDRPAHKAYMQCLLGP